LLPSPCLRVEFSESGSVQINFDIVNESQSALSLSSDFRLNVAANSFQEEQDTAVAAMLPAYMIKAGIEENVLPQRQLAGRA
jgi:hypothetical protein